VTDPMMAMADRFADLDRRLRSIEGGQRVGTTAQTAGSRLVLKSPNGSLWAVTVSNAGVLSAAAI